MSLNDDATKAGGSKQAQDKVKAAIDTEQATQMNDLYALIGGAAQGAIQYVTQKLTEAQAKEEKSVEFDVREVMDAMFFGISQVSGKIKRGLVPVTMHELSLLAQYKKISQNLPEDEMIVFTNVKNPEKQSKILGADGQAATKESKLIVPK